MTISDASSTTERAGGLTIALQTVTAPPLAFERLRVTPTWGWAFLIACLLGAIGTILSVPAALHSMSASMAHQLATNPHYAQMSEPQRRQMAASTLAAVRFGWAFVPFVLLITALLQTIVLLIFNAIGRGQANFKTLWAAVMNIAIPGFGFYLFVSGIIAVIRGPSAYNSALDSFLAMPSLAWIARHPDTATAAFQSAFNPFSFWTLGLTGEAMVRVARTSRVNAALAASAILTIGALISMWGGARS